MTDTPAIPQAHTVVQGPVDIGTEQRWLIELSDGGRAVLAQLAPDLARDASIRRRYVRDVERVAALRATSAVDTVDIGPKPDPRDPQAEAPWRLRPVPAGIGLDVTLGRAPLGLEEFARLFASVCDGVHAIHQEGAVLRDLRPQQITCTPDGRAVLCDIGLARVDVLSSHTASSLLLQGSPYAAPEQLFRTVVDQRADIYSLAAMMWHALTGALPFDDGPSLLRERPPLPSLAELRPDVPPSLAALIAAGLRTDPADRPASAAEFAWTLRGGAAMLMAREQVECQSCGATLLMGQRLCLECGAVSVRFEHCTPPAGWGLELVALDEDASRLRWLQEFLKNVSRQPMRAPDFIIGNVHLYDDDEKAGRLRLPARLFSYLTKDSALALQDVLLDQRFKVRLVSPNATARAALELLVAVVGLSIFATALYVVGLGASAAWIAVPALPIVGFMLARLNNRTAGKRTAGAFVLRDAPAALPASDPLVARLSALLKGRGPASGPPPEDVRNVIRDLALLAQRLVDHRVRLLGAGAAELAMVTAPVDALVSAVERHAHRLREMSAELGRLDEGAIVRELASSEAKGAPPSEREDLLQGLDRLRALEDQRAAVFHRLLEVQALLRRTIELGLSVENPAATHEVQMQLALAALE